VTEEKIPKSNKAGILQEKVFKKDSKSVSGKYVWMYFLRTALVAKMCRDFFEPEPEPCISFSSFSFFSRSGK